MLKQNLVMSASLITLSSTMVTQAIAQEVIDEIVVTARKKSESLQDVPIAVSALGEEQLEELGVDKFTDYLAQLPGVTAGGSGPGQNTIYIRGVASTTPNLTTAGVAGLAPNVALYLDEQPLTQPGRNLDVYAVDMERIEVLSGPQGTLFGASSQAGVVRLITNKPQIGETSVTGRAAFSITKGGDPSNKLEVVSNIPIGDKLAVRAVVYGDQQGGFIDNVAPKTELTAKDSARFRAEGTMRSNGVPVSAKRKGFQAGADLSGVNAEAANNSDKLADNFNDSEYSGVRLGVRYEADNGVNFTSSITSQRLEADGVFFDDPEQGEYKISRYQDDRLTDEFINANWTVDGTFNGLDVLYTGAMTERETDQVVDYTDYLFVGQYLPHYICDTSVSYPNATLSGDSLVTLTTRAPQLAPVQPPKAW
jgi:iron complex outermembrane receptor protein